MSEEQILDERAELYARLEELPSTGETRCLQSTLRDRRWLFPENQVRVLLPALKVTALPAGVSWNGWPCEGLASHALATYPLLSWSTLIGLRTTVGAQEESAVLLLREVPVALRVPGPLEMAVAVLELSQHDDHPWSAGRLPGGHALARLERLGAAR